MLKLLKIICISVICIIVLSGCSSKQEKVEQIKSNQLDHSETDNKTENRRVKTPRKKDFAIYLKDSSQKEQISSSVAKEIALKIIKSFSAKKGYTRNAAMFQPIY